MKQLPFNSSPSEPVNPADFLADHPITAHMRRLGLTDEQLFGRVFVDDMGHERFDCVRFKYQDGDEFSIWRVVSVTDWPEKLFHERRIWCALRWLILDDPPASRDRRDAWMEIAQFGAAPLIESGRRQYLSGKDSGTESHRQAEELRAEPARKAVAAALAKNPKLSKTGAVRQVAKDLDLGMSTVWSYLRNETISE